ncbi:hypothetical protein ACHAXT_008367 [Thalassiosira profunda]
MRTLFGYNDDTPRGIQERRDTYWIVLAIAHRKLRMEKQQSASWRDESKEQLQELMEEAAAHLDDKTDINNMPLSKLRGEVQTCLEPQIGNMLTVAQDVEGQMRYWHGVENEDDEDYELTAREEQEYKAILLKEYESVCQLLQTAADENDKKRRTSNPVPFYEMKKSAIETLLTYFDWWPEGPIVPEKAANVDAEYVDPFGFSPNKSDDILGPMRYYHARNLARSALVRQAESTGSDSGGDGSMQQPSSYHALSTYKSTVPNAGRGVFVDGFAPAGTLLAFIPGKVWPKEHLLSASLQTQMQFSENDPRHQLSIRYDDILIDSRQSPYTVVRNAWALGHIVNHPPAPSKVLSNQTSARAKNENEDGESDPETIVHPDYGPNCITVPINFTKQMLEKHEGLSDYLANEYEMPPKDYAKNALDSHHIAMHGVGLVALRDVKDEELFYDYRLSPDKDSKGGGYPSWYHVWDEEAMHNRWDAGGP